MEDYKKRTYKRFGPGSDYESEAVDNIKLYAGMISISRWRKPKFPAMSVAGNLQTCVAFSGPGAEPVPTPWKHLSIKEFLKNYEAGKSETGERNISLYITLTYSLKCCLKKKKKKKLIIVAGAVNDQQVDGVTKVAPLVAMYAGQEDMLDMVEEAVRVTQNDDVAVAFALAAARWISVTTPTFKINVYTKKTS